MRGKNLAKDLVPITMGTIIISAAVFFFLTPSHLALGSVAGLAIMLSGLLPLSVSMITLIINVLLLVVGFLLLGKEFGVKTVYVSILMPVIMGLLELLLPENGSITGDPFVDMVCFLFAASLGQSMLFHVNASSGGLDIVGKLLNKYLQMDLGKAISTAGLVIAVSSVFFYDLKTAVISVLGTYLSGIVLDHFIFDSDLLRRVCILSSKWETLLDYIKEELHSGATIYEATGAYTGIKEKEINVIVNKTEYRLLMDYIAKTDPSAFVTVYSASKVLYRPKQVK